MILADWNSEAKHNAKGTARRQEFVQSSTELLKRHEKITHLLYTGACVTCGSGKRTDLQSCETLKRALGVEGFGRHCRGRSSCLLAYPK